METYQEKMSRMEALFEQIPPSFRDRYKISIKTESDILVSINFKSISFWLSHMAKNPSISLTGEDGYRMMEIKTDNACVYMHEALTNYLITIH